jgi:hypothetical protein
MKTIRNLLLVLMAAAGISRAADVAGPAAPALQQVLKYRGPNIVFFEPVRMHSSHSLNVTHMRFGDGSVRPADQRGVLLVVYAAKANVDGNHEIYFQDFHFLSNTGSPVLNFADFQPGRDVPAAVDAEGRVGVICALIGLLRDPRTGEYKPSALPALDSISAQITPGGSDLGAGLLLPAVQKIRSAAARL